MLIVNDRKGVRHEYDAVEGQTLMPQLRTKKLGIIGICFGNMVCGTCHVYVEKEWLDRLPAPDELEEELLAEFPNRQENSRLTCQIEYRSDLDGIEMTVPPRG